jgi:hypothetical protein
MGDRGGVVHRILVGTARGGALLHKPRTARRRATAPPIPPPPAPVAPPARPGTADFDTHDDHTARHDRLLRQLDQAVDAFLSDLQARGIADKVLLAMTSEFGRRVLDNESNGLDHGAGNFLFLLGPVGGGLYGEYPDLAVDRLDRDQNLVATVSMADYYASLAEDWFGVPSSEVIPGGTKVAGLIS